MFGRGKFRPIIDGLIAGAGGQIATNFIGGYGHPVASIGVGFIRNNQVLLTEGSRELGAQLAAQFTGGSSPYGGAY